MSTEVLCPGCNEAIPAVGRHLEAVEHGQAVQWHERCWSLPRFVQDRLGQEITFRLHTVDVPACTDCEERPGNWLDGRCEECVTDEIQAWHDYELLDDEPIP